MKGGGHNFHPSNVPGRTKFLLNLELEREKDKERSAKKKRKGRLFNSVSEAFKDKTP